MMSRTSRRIRIGSAVAVPVAVAVFAALVTLGAPPAGAATATLKSAAEAKGRYFGTALNTAHTGEALYASTAADQFDMVTPENEMKWDTTEPSNGSYNFGPGDAVVSFAQAHSQRVRGHNLVWHSQLPGWVSSLPSSQVQSVMENHITTEATHYQGKVYAWDVVNEPFDDSGNLRTDVFYTAMGTNYIADALRTARAADPNAKLYLNDYNIEGTGAKSNAMYNLVSSLKSQGVPIDGVGFESHLIVGQVPSTLGANLARFAALGLDVAITELDIRMPTPASSANLAQQATDYRTVTNACLATTRCVGITVWGVTDKYSWVPSTFSGQGAALLFDENYAAKPAETAVVTALGGATSGPTSSSPSPTGISPTPSPTGASPSTGPTGPTGSCRVAYTVSSQWNVGFTASVSITNTGSVAISGWSLKFIFPSGQTVTQGWNAAWSQSGSAVTATNLSYNSAIGAGGTVSAGFNGAWSGSNTAPTSFTLNGSACTTS